MVVSLAVCGDGNRDDRGGVAVDAEEVVVLVVMMKVAVAAALSMVLVVV